MGSMLDEFRVYGYSGGIENRLHGQNSAQDGEHNWITEELCRKKDN